MHTCVTKRCWKRYSITVHSTNVRFTCAPCATTPTSPEKVSRFPLGMHVRYSVQYDYAPHVIVNRINSRSSSSLVPLRYRIRRVHIVNVRHRVLLDYTLILIYTHTYRTMVPSSGTPVTAWCQVQMNLECAQTRRVTIHPRPVTGLPCTDVL